MTYFLLVDGNEVYSGKRNVVYTVFDVIHSVCPEKTLVIGVRR